MSPTRFRQAAAEDAERCYQIEIGAYEGDEAATLEKIRTRIGQYPQGFLILEQGDEIVGFINSGCAHDMESSNLRCVNGNGLVTYQHGGGHLLTVPFIDPTMCAAK